LFRRNYRINYKLGSDELKGVVGCACIRKFGNEYSNSEGKNEFKRSVGRYGY
jgi:hypothetical protein